MNEFELIRHYFQSSCIEHEDVILGIGDDGAILSVPDGHQLVVSTDTLVAETHFLTTVDPRWVGHKALAANLSDMAAMGATPRWISLALTLPNADITWLSGFCDGFFALAKQHNVALIGGDTTKGPLSITITIQGIVPNNTALRRSGANVGDDIYITGVLGHSHFGLACLLDTNLPVTDEKKVFWQKEHHYREPKVEFSVAARQAIHAALDISDGLCADLSHILMASNVGAVIDVDCLPISPLLLEIESGNQRAVQQRSLISGEEYELCFTAAPSKRNTLMHIAEKTQTKITRIGQITQSKNQLDLVAQGERLDWALDGYDHFKELQQ